MVLDIGKLAYGGAFVLGGVGVGYVSGKFLPEKFRPIGTIAALGLGIYGLYSVYQAFTEEEAEVPTADLSFPISITDPTPGEKWSTLLPHTVNVEVHNPYPKRYALFIGMSLMHDETGTVYDYPIKEIKIDPNEIKGVVWWVTDYYGGRGLHWVMSSVWNILPTGDCEMQGICNRLGISESNVEFGIFG